MSATKEEVEQKKAEEIARFKSRSRRHGSDVLQEVTIEAKKYASMRDVYQINITVHHAGLTACHISCWSETLPEIKVIEEKVVETR